MVQRLTYRRHSTYATRSNVQKVVKTPGGKLTYHLKKKRTNIPVCPISGQKLNGLKSMRPRERANASRNQLTVSRAYGGHLAAGVVRERIVRAFLVEEQKIVRKVLKLQKTKEVAAAKQAAKQGKKESKGKKASKK